MAVPGYATLDLVQTGLFIRPKTLIIHLPLTISPMFANLKMTPALRKLLLTLPLVFATLLTIVYLGDDPQAAVAVMIALTAVMFLIDRSPSSFVLFLVIFATGPIMEAIAVFGGAWSYTNPAVVGVPIWLFFVWGITGMYIVRLKEFVESDLSEIYDQDNSD